MSPSDVRIIQKWQYNEVDLYIEIHPTDPNLPEAQIKTRSAQIQAQQTDFTKLLPTEQARIRTDSAAGKLDNRFGSYLMNQILGQRFAQLKPFK